MIKKWIDEEYSCVNINDKRLKTRLKLMLTRMFESPMASIKSSFKGCKEVIAAYRFFNNSRTSAEIILEPHKESTLERVKQEKRVLIIQDTTEIDYTKKKSLKNAGRLDAPGRQGFYLHNQMVVTPERLSLGIWNVDINARSKKKDKKSSIKNKPIEEKESYRWLEGYRDACELATLAPDTQIISCSDREGDIYEIFEEHYLRQANGTPTADFLIRCCQDRCLSISENENNNQKNNFHKKILEKVQSTTSKKTITVNIKQKIQSKKNKKGSRVKINRSARTVCLEVRFDKVNLRPPYRKEKKLSEVLLNVIIISEKNPPKDQEPINWVLLTSMQVDNAEQAIEILDLYLARWEIEVFFRVLKTGCKIEELQLKEANRIRVAIALYMVVAWRVLYVMKLGRDCPDLPCDVIFEEDEWQAFWVICYGEEAISEKPLLGEFVSKIAEFGGFMNRKNDGYPGPQSIWQGLSRLRDFVIAWQVFIKKQGSLYQKLD